MPRLVNEQRYLSTNGARFASSLAGARAVWSEAMGGTDAAAARVVRMRALAADDTTWDPVASVKPVLNVSMDAMLVESGDASSPYRVSTSHVVALDGMIDERMRRRLLERVTEAGWDESRPEPPSATWERRTTDTAGAVPLFDGDDASDDDASDDASRHSGASPTWGLKPDAMRRLETDAATNDWAFRELHGRLAKLFPNLEFAHMPADDMRPRAESAAESASPTHACDAFVANAATRGDAFRWHVDADPTSLPLASPFVDALGSYVNGDPGKPRLVSMIVYLNERWKPSWDAETLFLDRHAQVGAIVRPRPGRVVLMDQDVTHRVSPPSDVARRPRYSLVWKLAVTPRRVGGSTSFAKPEWGTPSPLGSAARLRAIMAAVRRSEDETDPLGAVGKRKRSEEEERNEGERTEDTERSRAVTRT